MLGFYQKAEPVTADISLAADTIIALVGAAENAPNTITLPPAKDRVNNPIYVFNQSLYAQKVTGASGDSVFGQSLALPGQFIRYDSDGSDWYCLNPPGMQAVISKSLAAADLIAMQPAPVSLVPAQGAGRVVLVQSYTIQIVRTATAFTGGGAVEVRYTDGSGAKVGADISSSFITGAAGTAYVTIAGVVTELTPVVNAPIVITNAGGVPFAAGTGTAKVRLACTFCDFN